MRSRSEAEEEPQIPEVTGREVVAGEGAFIRADCPKEGELRSSISLRSKRKEVGIAVAEGPLARIRTESSPRRTIALTTIGTVAIVGS